MGRNEGTPGDDDVVEVSLEQKLNGETARIAWAELERTFARGDLVVVNPGLDLVAIAASMARNAAEDIAGMVDCGDIRRAEMEDARRWQQLDQVFWGVVVAPWVLVQEINEPG